MVEITNPFASASIKEFRQLIKDNVEQNKDNAKIDEKQSASLQKLLGISERRLQQSQKAGEEARASREELNKLRSQLEKQGVDVKNNTKFQKLEVEVKKKERDAELQAKPLASSLKEQAKDAGSKLRETFMKFLGPNSFVGKLFGGIASGLKSKVVGGLNTIFGALKTGTFILFLFAFAKFLQSDLWKDYKERLIPLITNAAAGIRDSLTRIFTAFFGDEGSFVNGIDQIMKEIFGEDSKIYNAIRNIGAGFFGEGGSFNKGMRTLFAETFGEDSLIFKAARLLKNTFATIATGLTELVDLLTPPFFTDEDGTPYTARELAQKVFMAFVGLTGALVTLGLLFRPGKMFMVGGKLLFKSGKWILFKPIQAAFASLFGALGILGTQADDLAKSTVKGAAAGATKGLKGKPIKGATYEMGGKKFRFEGQQFVDVESGKIATKAQASSLRSGIQGGSVSFTDPVEANKKAIFKKFPKIASLFSGPGKAILRALPALGTLLTIGEGARILLSDSPRNEKIESLGGLLFGTLGASGLAIVGGLAGSVGGPFGAIGGGILGGALGFVAGDFAGKQLAKFLLGDEPESPSMTSERFSNKTGGTPGANFQFSDEMKAARGAEDLQALKSLFTGGSPTDATDITPTTATGGNGGGGAFFNAPQVIGGDTINNRAQTIKLIGDPDPFISKGLLSVGGFSTP